MPEKIQIITNKLSSGCFYKDLAIFLDCFNKTILFTLTTTLVAYEKVTATLALHQSVAIYHHMSNLHVHGIIIVKGLK